MDNRLAAAIDRLFVSAEEEMHTAAEKQH